MRGVSLTHPVLAFLYIIFCFVLFLSGSFSYTSHAGFNFIWGVFLTYPLLACFVCGEFLLHIPCLLLFYLGSFSDASHALLIFLSGVSLTHPTLA